MINRSSSAGTAPPTSRRRPVRSAAPRGTLPLGLALVSTTAAVGLAIRGDAQHPFFQGLDNLWLDWMDGPHKGLPAVLAAALNWFGGPFGTAVPLLMLIGLLVYQRWRTALYVLTVYVVSNALVVSLLKNLVNRPGPAHPLVLVSDGSFPSGHAFGAATIVVVIGSLLRRRSARRRWLQFGTVFTVAMMWSRTWLHANWLSDTVAGAVAGVGTALILWCAFGPLLAREASAASSQWS